MAELEKKLKRLRKINFGCGWDIREGYLNVDMWPDCNPDLVIENSDYSIIPKNHYKEMLANDVLEHIPRTETLSYLLDWSEYLKKGGKLYLQTSSVLGVAKQLQNHSKFADQYGWLTCLFGNQAHAGDFHHNGFTKQVLSVYLVAAGYKIDSIKLRDKWLLHVDCHKEYDWTNVIKNYQKNNNSEYVDAIFLEAFGRKPDWMGGEHILNALNEGIMDRRAALRHLLQSPERLYFVASKKGL